MNIMINHNSSIRVSEDSCNVIKNELSDRFGRFGDSITRIDVFFSDENGGKKGFEDKKCLIEAHVGHLDPIVVSSDGGNIYGAFEEASDKLLTSMNSAMGKIRDQIRHPGTALQDYPASL